MLKILFIVFLSGIALSSGLFAAAEPGLGTFRLSEAGERSAAFMTDASMFFHYLKKNDKAKAAEKLQEAIDKDPYSIAFGLIAVEFYGSGDLSEEKFIALAENHPESAFLCGMVADALASKGKMEKAEKLLDFAVAYRLEPRKDGEPPAGITGERHPEELQIMFASYLEILIHLKKFDKADRFLQKADEVCRMELSENALLSRVRYYLMAKQENPGNTSYSEKYGKFAGQLLKKLDGPNRFCTEVSDSLVKLLLKERNSELLEALLGEALLTNPASPAAYRNLETLFSTRRDPGNALRAFSRELLLARAAKKTIPLRRFPVILLYTIASNDEINLRKRVDLLAGMNLMNENLYFHVSEFFIEKKNYRQALVYAERIKTAGMKNALIALIMQRQKKYGEALKLYLKLERENPDSMLFKMSVAEMARKAGDTETERQFVNEMVLKAEGHPELQNYLGYTWADRGIKLDQAEKYIRSALKADPENYAYLDSLAWVLYRKKALPEAKKIILEAIKKCQDRFSVGVLLDHAGDIFAALGEKDKACEYWQKAVQTGDPELEPDTILKKINTLCPPAEPEQDEPEQDESEQDEPEQDEPGESLM